MAICDICGKEAKEGVGMKLHMAKAHGPKQEGPAAAEAQPSAAAESAQEPKAGASEIDALREQVAALMERDAENQKKLQMLYDVADKGRVYSWEQKQQSDKKPQKVNLSVVDGKVVIGWRTVKDELITDPRTGRTVGESQEYELLLLGDDGEKSARPVSGYLNFSNCRYDRRIECEVLGRSESFDGKSTCSVRLPGGRIIELDARFLN